MLQAVVVAALEENLYGGVHDDEDEHIYPAAFVVLTSLLGFYVVSRLQLNAKVGPAAAWLTKCIYVAKLSVLIIPEVSRAPSSLLPAALWLVTAEQDTEEAWAAPQDQVCSASELMRHDWSAGPADHTRAAGDSGCHAAVPAADDAPRPSAGSQRGRAHAAAPSLAGELDIGVSQWEEAYVLAGYGARRVCCNPAAPCQVYASLESAAAA